MITYPAPGRSPEAPPVTLAVLRLTGVHMWVPSVVSDSDVTTSYSLPITHAGAGSGKNRKSMANIITNGSHGNIHDCFLSSNHQILVINSRQLW